MLSDRNSLFNLTRLPLPVRRRLLRASWQALRIAGHLPKLEAQEVLRYAMRVSRVEAARIEREMIFHDWLCTMEWGALVRRTKPQALRDARAVMFDNPDVLRSLSQSGRPLIFTPLHMGGYALAFATLMLSYFPHRRMLILRAREDRPEDTQAMERISEIGIDMRFLNVHDKQSYLDAIRFARDGAIIVTFVDLPASYGNPANVTLFGRPAQLAMGLNSLARIAKATIVPVAVTSSQAGDVMKIGRPFESYENGPGERARVAEIVRRHIEQSVLACPEQWHMWPRLHEFLDTARDREVA